MSDASHLRPVEGRYLHPREVRRRYASPFAIGLWPASCESLSRILAAQRGTRSQRERAAGALMDVTEHTVRRAHGSYAAVSALWRAHPEMERDLKSLPLPTATIVARAHERDPGLARELLAHAVAGRGAVALREAAARAEAAAQGTQARISYEEGVRLIAGDDEAFDSVRLYVQNFESGIGEAGPAMDRFCAILARMPAERRYHALWRGECRGQYWREKFGRGFHSWSGSLRTARYFHGECMHRDAAQLLVITAPVRAVSLSDIVTERMRLRQDESHYSGDQAEWLALDADAVAAAREVDPGTADAENDRASASFWR